MQTLTVTPNEAGQRMDKLLAKYLDQAGKGFLYKMMRKKTWRKAMKSSCSGPMRPLRSSRQPQRPRPGQRPGTDIKSWISSMKTGTYWW